MHGAGPDLLNRFLGGFLDGTCTCGARRRADHALERIAEHEHDNNDRQRRRLREYRQRCLGGGFHGLFAPSSGCFGSDSSFVPRSIGVVVC